MKKTFRREALILFLSGLAFACSEVASSPAASQKEASLPTPAFGFATPSGARVVVSHSARDMMSRNGASTKTIPTLIMVTKDEVEVVASFYEKELSGWQHKELVGTHMFWQGDSGEHFMEAAASMTRPYVSIQEYDDVMLLPGAGDAVTLITIAYVPEK